MGAGKSTAMQILKSRGIETVDTDFLARQVVDSQTAAGREAVKQLAQSFGSQILNDDGHSLDRARLRDRISSNAKDRDELESILHPLILKGLTELQRGWETQGLPVAFVEGTRLVESGYVHSLSGCILVTADEALRFDRVMNRSGLTREQARALFQLQNESFMRKACQVVWENHGHAGDLESQILAFLADHGFSEYL